MGVFWGLYYGYIGIMDKKMETTITGWYTISGLGFWVSTSWGGVLLAENLAAHLYLVPSTCPYFAFPGGSWIPLIYLKTLYSRNSLDPYYLVPHYYLGHIPSLFGSRSVVGYQLVGVLRVPRIILRSAGNPPL